MVLGMPNFPLDADFHALAQHELAKWKVPGLTIAVIHGPYTHSKAYGIAEFPDEPMTVHSLFSTCSTTKAFTAAAASLVIDDSKSTSVPVSWDTPVSSLIRDDFVLADDHATAHTTLEDALSHRTGLSGHFGAVRWAHATESLRDAVRKLRHLPLARPPRSTWDYCNHMYMAVSHALEQRTGVDLGSFLQRRIWAPLHSLGGYSWIPDSEYYTPEPYMNYSRTTGTGAIVSNVLDYARWLRALIYKSTPLSRPIFDLLLYWHSGSWSGFGTQVGFVPEREFGFVVMGNTVDVRTVGKALYTRLMDKLLGLCPKDSHGPVIKMKDSGCREAQGLDVSRLANSLPPSLPLEQYTGVYVHPAYGSVAFEVHDGNLGADFADRMLSARLDLEHASGEFFAGKLYTPGGEARERVSFLEMEFYVSRDGKAQRVGLDLEDALKGKVWFEKAS